MAVPDLSEMRPELFTISKRWLGPAASPLSGGRNLATLSEFASPSNCVRASIAEAQVGHTQTKSTIHVSSCTASRAFMVRPRSPIRSPVPHKAGSWRQRVRRLPDRLLPALEPLRIARAEWLHLGASRTGRSCRTQRRHVHCRVGRRLLGRRQHLPFLSECIRREPENYERHDEA